MVHALAFVALEVAGVVVPGGDLRTPAACPETRAGEIVVCHHAVETDRYRLRQRLPETPSALPRAEWGLGGGVRMGVEVSSGAMPQGAVSNRAMVKLKVPF